ncbi:MAG: hypothetical protein A2156_07310 [Deltaproteobacteria bacterium RBG_16_48_10]|nr:MAG: hypothetical protein A2156_07310 [Deltaproteobacteria bacterium RBG_16_48_10]
MALKSREKVLLLFAFIAIAILVFDQIYYTPQSRKISRLKEEVKATELKSNESLLMAKGIETVGSEVSRLEKELQGLKGRTFSRDRFEAFLRHLAKESNRLQLKMISMMTQEEGTPARDEKKEPSPSQYKKVHLQMILHSNFNSLGNYLKAIDELPFLVAINNLQVERDEKIFPLLKVTLGVTVYLILS